MSIKQRIIDDIKTAMRAKDSARLETLRLVTAAVKQIEVDERIDVDDARMLVILDKLVKQRKESITQFETAGRADLIAQEQSELEIIKAYLPEPLTDQEIDDMVAHSIQSIGADKMADMGKVMASLKPQLQGRADMAKVSACIKARLS